MLVYDITNEKSFDNIKNWIRNIEEVGAGSVGRLDASLRSWDALVWFHLFMLDFV